MRGMTLIQLSEVFSDENKQGWYQAFPFGNYRHQTLGEIRMDARIAQQMADNVNAGVVGSQLPINFGHNKEGPAAGWIEKAEVRDDGLYLHIDWTPVGVEKIVGKEYRYLSPEYFDKWKSPKTGNMHANVMMGAGLTNNPFLLDIAPIEMSREEATMELAANLREVLELSADSTDEQVLEAVKATVEVANQPLPEERRFSATLEQTADPMEQIANELSNRGLDDAAKLMTSMQNQITALELSNKQQSVERHLERWQNAPHAFSTATAEKVRDVMMDAPDDVNARFV